MKIEPLGIEQALEDLTTAYPDEHFEAHIYLNWFGENRRRFRFSVEERKELGLPGATEYGDTVSETVELLKQRLGSRDPESMKQRRIAELREQLAQLEGK
jgi:hypothetical protein